MIKPSDRNGASRKRIGSIDAARGLAILGVVIFHFVWDLEFAGFISGIAFHPIWLAFGKSLAGSFMILVGVSLVLAHQDGFRLHAFTKRLFVIALAAAIISIVTWFIFPGSFIYFGILHSVAVASLVGLVFLKMPSLVTFMIGVFVFVAPIFYTSTVFDTRWLAWIGFASIPPRSDDFVPIFPWLGLTLIGMALTKLAKKQGWEPHFFRAFKPTLVATSLQWLGQKSLAIYLIHQPVMLAFILPISGFFSGP